MQLISHETHLEFNKAKGALMVDYGRLNQEKLEKPEGRVAFVECYELQDDGQFLNKYSFTVENPIMRQVSVVKGVANQMMIFKSTQKENQKLFFFHYQRNQDSEEIEIVCRQLTVDKQAQEGINRYS
jgi:hypothetical protein